MDSCFSKIVYFDVLNSTNDFLIQLYKQLHYQKGYTIYTEKQLQGRGRMGKQWFSDSNSLTFSFSLNSGLSNFEITILAVLGLIDLLKDYGVSALVKFPNDIIVDNKKIAGILTELVAVKRKKYVIIGIGLNVNNLSFPSGLSDVISMSQVTEIFYKKQEVFELVISKLEYFFFSSSREDSDVKQKYFSHLIGFKKYIPCLIFKKKNIVKILDLQKEGFLLIQKKDSNVVERVNSRDIQFFLN